MTILRLQLTGEPERIEDVRAQLAHLDEVGAVDSADPPPAAFANDDSSIADLAESQSAAVVHLEIDLDDDADAEDILLIAENAAMEAGVAMERVDRF